MLMLYVQYVKKDSEEMSMGKEAKQNAWTEHFEWLRVGS